MIPKYLMLPVVRLRVGSWAAESQLSPDSGSIIYFFQLTVYCAIFEKSLMILNVSLREVGGVCRYNRRSSAYRLTLCCELLV